MSKFQSLYHAVTQSCIVAGIIILLDSVNGLYNNSKLFNVYSLLSVLPLVYTSITAAISVFTVDENVASAIVYMAGSMLMVLYNAFFYIRRHSLCSLIETLNRVTNIMSENDVFGTVHKNYITLNSPLVNVITKYFIIVQCTLCSAMTVYLCVSHYVFQSYFLMYPPPYNIHSYRGLFDLTLFGQGVAICYGALKQSACLCFSLCVLVHLFFCLKQLKFSCDRLFQDFIN